jgi:hypothetical protein
VKRISDELLRAISGYLDPDEGSMYDSAYERARCLFRVIGLSARGIARR